MIKILYAGLPDSNDLIGLVINLEVQQRMSEYPIMKRVYSYLGRLIARQKGHLHGFDKSDYDKFARTISKAIEEYKGLSEGYLEIKGIYPLRFIKRIVSMFCSCTYPEDTSVDEFIGFDIGK